MKQKTPDHRYCKVQEAIKNKKAPTNGVEAELFSLIQGKTASDVVDYAYDIYSSTFKREVMEAFLLVETTSSEINEILQVPEAVTETYAHLFFDTEVFRNELDRISYAYTYTRDLFGTEIKKFAVDLGKESLKIRMSRGSYVVNSSEVHDGIRSTAYLMGQMARVNPLDSRIAKESLNWAKLGLKAATTEETEGKSNDIDKVSIALKSKDNTTDAEEMGVKPDEILH